MTHLSDHNHKLHRQAAASFSSVVKKVEGVIVCLTAGLQELQDQGSLW